MWPVWPLPIRGEMKESKMRSESEARARSSQSPSKIKIKMTTFTHAAAAEAARKGDAPTLAASLPDLARALAAVDEDER